MEMSIGALFVGVALAVVVVAYVARPFRMATKEVDPQKAIESWVARIREEQEANVEAIEPAGKDLHPDRIKYCPACGRQVGADDQFCSGCGVRLRGGKA
jgi:hypothetical protein